MHKHPMTLKLASNECKYETVNWNINKSICAREKLKKKLKVYAKWQNKHTHTPYICIDSIGTRQRLLSCELFLLVSFNYERNMQFMYLMVVCAPTLVHNAKIYCMRINCFDVKKLSRKKKTINCVTTSIQYIVLAYSPQSSEKSK